MTNACSPVPKTWVKSTGYLDSSQLASSADGLKLVAVRWEGGVITSTDGGVTWTDRTAAAGTRRWTSAASSADGTKLVATERWGGIYGSNDSGVTWSIRASTTREWIGSAMSSDGSTIFVTVGGDSSSNWGIWR
jgi:photosystem II stability/assembly factor-like uncharacterized protein